MILRPENEAVLTETRRQFFARGARGLGIAALASLMAEASEKPASGGLAGLPHFAPKAKRAIYLHMVGAPPQMDLFDYKPEMKQWYDKDLPDSIRQGQRLTTMTSGQSRFPIAPSVFKFSQHGQSGAWISELLPNTAKLADDLTIIRSMHTEAINHEPAITFIQTGNMVAGKPCIGSWMAYGLGSMNQDLPTFVVLNAAHSHPKANVQAISARLWSAGFLSGEHAGVALRSSGDPVLYINNPDGVPTKVRRRMLDALGELNEAHFARIGDPETRTRIAQYEMAFRMQTSVPELVDISDEPQHVLDLYGPDVKEPGTFAYNCLLARRMAQRGVRFTQVFLRGWDHHGSLPGSIKQLAPYMDGVCAALVKDLKQQGLLEDTLVVWGGEFGRTVYSQGTLTKDNYGRDHHPRCFTMWMAGGGAKPGIVHGETDDFSYNVTEKPVHIHDLNATILHCLGIDHEKLTYRFQGRDFRLTDVHGEVVKDILT
jgi:hypothetical protein